MLFNYVDVVTLFSRLHKTEIESQYLVLVLLLLTDCEMSCNLVRDIGERKK